MSAPSVVATPPLHKVGCTVWIILGAGNSARGHQARVQSVVETPGMEGYVIQPEKTGTAPTFLYPSNVAKDEEHMRALILEAKTPLAKRVSPRLAGQRSGPY